ncbi:MAG: hypothetical protein JWM33_160 [Caulobacteraceae bacterium]|nr:hypothetical protein [Caulobacteraceae bacterium]
MASARSMALLTSVGAGIFMAGAWIFPVAMGAKGITPGMVILNAVLPSKLSMLMSAIVWLVAVCAALPGRGTTASFLKAAGWTALILGLIGMAFEVYVEVSVMFKMRIFGMPILGIAIINLLYLGLFALVAAATAFALSARAAKNA